MLPRFPFSVHTDASTPAGTTRCSCRLSSQVVVGLPLISGGSAPTLPFSRIQRNVVCRYTHPVGSHIALFEDCLNPGHFLLKSRLPHCPFRGLLSVQFKFRPVRSPSCSTQPFSPECFSPCRTLQIESGAGAPALGSGGLSVAFAPCLQFGSLDRVSSPPLIKPDVRISRIRLTDEITPSPTEDPWSSAQV